MNPIIAECAEDAVRPRTGTHRIRSTAGRLAVVLLGVLAMVVTLIALPGTADAHSTWRKASRTELAIAKVVLRELNQERSYHGLRPLKMDWHLRLSARRHNRAMAAANTMSHQLPGEADFTHRISKAGYHWNWAGENVAWNSQMDVDGMLAVQRFMYNEKPPEDGHRQNILSAEYRNVGVDVYFDQPHDKLWLTTDFGRH